MVFVLSCLNLVTPNERLSVSFNSRCRYFEEFACKQVVTLNPCVNLCKSIAHRYFFDPRMCMESRERTREKAAKPLELVSALA